MRSVKREVRALGLVIKKLPNSKKFKAVGVIFRGKFWLDGVIKTTTSNLNLTESIVSMIKRSPHFPQIRVILLHESLLDRRSSIDISEISRRSKKPVIFIFTTGSKNQIPLKDTPSTEQYFQYTKNGSKFYCLSIGLSNRTAIKVIKNTTREGVLPEPLRVASLIMCTLKA